MNIENKNHWYDGLFYDKLIAPNQDEAFMIINTLIKSNSKVLDAGCGTGRLAFQLADKCERFVGIDLSNRNIQVAKKLLSRNFSPKIFFYHANVQSYLTVNKIHFDYSIVSYVIHEVEENQREIFLKVLASASERIIIADYLFPQPKSFTSLLNVAVEFAAGKDHYRNFKSYLNENGILGLAEKTGLKVEREIRNSPLTSHIVVLKNEL